MSTATLEDTAHYLRITCPANRRAELGRYLYESAEVIDDQIVALPYAGGSDYNVVVTNHPSEFLARYQAGRIHSSGAFGAEQFDSLEAAMELPEFLKPEVKTALPTLSSRTAGTSTSTCGLYVESAGSTCILKSGHNGNCRTK